METRPGSLDTIKANGEDERNEINSVRGRGRGDG